MRKKTAKTNLRMPIFGGVEVARGKEVQLISKGVCIVEGKVARQVQKLFVDSARFMNDEPPEGFTTNEPPQDFTTNEPPQDFTTNEPPQGFTMTAGEIFYEGGAIAEARLRGNLPLIKDEEWSDFDLFKDEEWIEMIRIKNEHWTKFPIFDDEEWVWELPIWSTKHRPDFSWVDDLRLAFSPRHLGRPFVAALRIGRPILLWWDVKSAHTRHTPADSDVRRVRITQPVKVTGGKADKRGYEAAIRYADGLARSADAMKTLLSQLRDGGELTFIDERRAFGSAFGRLLTQRIDESSPDSTGQLSFSMKKLKEPKMREKMLNAVAAMTSDYFLIKPGRPRGSQTKNPKLKAEKKELSPEEKAELKKMILRAITGQYKTLLHKFPPAEAESQLKKKVVNKGLNVSKNTFDNWLECIGCSFEELKTEVMREDKN